jgi:putative membrane protein
MMNGWGMSGGYGFGFGGIFMILWWVLLIVLVVGLAKWMLSSFGGSGHGASSSKALEILKERYARGEIDEQEFQQRKRDLSE